MIENIKEYIFFLAKLVLNSGNYSLEDYWWKATSDIWIFVLVHKDIRIKRLNQIIKETTVKNKSCGSFELHCCLIAQSFICWNKKKSCQSSIVQKVDSMILHMAENKNLLNGVWLLINTDHVCWTWNIMLETSPCFKVSPCLSTSRKSILYSVFSFECS